jgi:hypothetical protein
MNVCERCGADLIPGSPLYRCHNCEWKNDALRYLFACSDRYRAECDCCEERLCRCYSELGSRVMEADQPL